MGTDDEALGQNLESKNSARFRNFRTLPAGRTRRSILRVEMKDRSDSGYINGLAYNQIPQVTTNIYDL